MRDDRTLLHRAFPWWSWVRLTDRYHSHGITRLGTIFQAHQLWVLIPVPILSNLNQSHKSQLIILDYFSVSMDGQVQIDAIASGSISRQSEQVQRTAWGPTFEIVSDLTYLLQFNHSHVWSELIFSYCLQLVSIWAMRNLVLCGSNGGFHMKRICHTSFRQASISHKYEGFYQLFYSKALVVFSKHGNHRNWSHAMSQCVYPLLLFTGMYVLI